jgi:drug/metabolite transporter (DMT)-like permease
VPEPSPSRRTEIIGLSLAAGGTALFSLKAIVIKLSYAYPVDAVTLQTLRMLLAVPLYLLIAGVLLGIGGAARLTVRQWLAVGGLGLCGYYVASILDLMGLQHISAGLERLILYVYPTMVLLIGRFAFGRRLQARELVGMTVSYLGLAIVFGQDLALYQDGAVVGALLVLASAAAYALFIAGSGRLIPLVGSTRFTCYAMTAAGIGVGLQYLVRQPTDLLTLPPQVYWLGALLAVACTVVPSFMIAAGIGRIGSERTALVGMIGPACTLALGNLILGEPLTVFHVIGTLLVLGGILHISRAPAKPAAGVQPAPKQA